MTDYLTGFDPTDSLPVAQQTQMAQSQLRLANRNLERALANNPRYPVAEMTRIREATAIDPRFFDNTRSMQIRLAEVEDYVRDEIASNKMIAEDPNQPAELRQGARRAINDMEQYLSKFGSRPDWLEQQRGGAAPPPPADDPVEAWLREQGL